MATQEPMDILARTVGNHQKDTAKKLLFLIGRVVLALNMPDYQE